MLLVPAVVRVADVLLVVVLVEAVLEREVAVVERAVVLELIARAEAIDGVVLDVDVAEDVCFTADA